MGIDVATLQQHFDLSQAKLEEIVATLEVNASEENDLSYARYLLKAAAEKNNYEIFKLLFDSYKNKENHKFLFYAIRINNARMIDFLFQAGVDINLVDDEGLNAFHHAKIAGNEELAQFLLNQNIKKEVNIIPDNKKFNDTPLMHAIRHKKK